MAKELKQSNLGVMMERELKDDFERICLHLEPEQTMSQVARGLIRRWVADQKREIREAAANGGE